MQNKVIIILSGYNQRALISLIRVLNKNNIPFKIVTLGKNDPIFLTKYCNNIIFQRKTQKLTIKLFDKISKYISNNYKYDKLIVLPSSEFLNRFLLKNRNKLEKLNFEIPLVKEATYQTISDKYRFTNLCKSSGIKVPNEFTHYSNFPFVAKPKYFFSEKNKAMYPYIIKSYDELKKFKNNENPNNFFYEQYIDGDSIYLLFYFSKSGEVIKYSQKNLIQQANGKSIIAAKAANYHKNIIANKFIEIFNKLKYFGPVMVEIKSFQDLFYLIEANPRIWGPSQLFVDANIPIFEKYLVDLGFVVEINNLDPKDSINYFWYGGMFPLPVSNRNEIVFHNYKWNDFVRDFPDFLNNDVYRRSDTENIFIKEINKNYEIN